MIIPALVVFVGLILLAWSADRFVYGAAATARNLGVSPLVIGLTIVGFGTSVPELLVSSLAAWQGNPGLAIGNAVGSNIANIGLVLGLAAAVSPLIMASRILKREFPLMVLTILLALALVLDGHISRVDGVVLSGALLLLLGWVTYSGMSQRHRRRDGDELAREYEVELREVPPLRISLLWLVLGLVLLLVSARLLVWGAIEIAQLFGISDVVIGLTVVAIGTSLPEVATSIASSLKDEDDIALGNIVGSNMFNMLGVIGVAGLITPVAVAPELVVRDFPVMLSLVLAMLVLGYRRRGPLRYNRFAGLCLLAGYTGYLGYLATRLPL